jgi:hypothetical protein
MTVCYTYVIPSLLFSIGIPILISFIINKFFWVNEGKIKFMFYIIFTVFSSLPLFGFFGFLVFDSCKIGYIAWLF